jgi:hypothetical protein
VKTGTVFKTIPPSDNPPIGWTIPQNLINEIPELTLGFSFGNKLDGYACTFTNAPLFNYPFPSAKKYYVPRAGPREERHTGSDCSIPAGMDNFTMESCDLPVGSTRIYGGDEPDCGHSYIALDFAEGPYANDQDQYQDWVMAMYEGDVMYAQFNPGGYGNCVIIRHSSGIVTLYAHMENESLLVDAGDHVQTSKPLGKEGKTGNVTGEHIHIELRSKWINGWANEEFAYPQFSPCNGCTPQEPYVYGAEGVCDNITEQFNNSWSDARDAGPDATPDEWNGIDWGDDQTVTITSR